MKYKLCAHKISIILAVSILIFLGGCNTKSKELNAMLESSVATMHLSTGREVNRSQQDRRSGFIKPTFAQLQLDYEPADNHTKDELFNEIIATLEKDNWRPSSVPQPDYYKATLPQGNFSLVATVYNIPEYSFVRVILTTDPT